MSRIQSRFDLLSHLVSSAKRIFAIVCVLVKLDIAVSNNDIFASGTVWGTVSVLLGRGDGRFE
jgi:hypothetical protein